MPKAYIMGQLNIADPEAYKAYATQVPAIVRRFGGTYLVRAGKVETLDGNPIAERNVVIEFADRAAAETFYRSADYQEILGIRLANSTGFIVLVDGVDSE